jgi:hypothetical protein
MRPTAAGRRTLAGTCPFSKGTTLRLSRSARSVLAALATAVICAGLASGSSPAVGASSPARSQVTRQAPGQAAPRATPQAPSQTGKICGTYCDGTPAALAGPYREADSVQVQRRVIRLNIDDTDQTAFAVISNGSPTDEVWIDRSWDGGRSWDSKVGDTRIPRASHSDTTTQWNLDKGRATSVVRACGKAGNRPQIACTGWNPTQPVPKPGRPWDRGAVDALMSLYDRHTGLWRGTGWWNSANALTSLIDYMSATHDRRYRWVVANTFDRDRSVAGGNFTNNFLDDTGWWALAWIRAYDLTHRPRYLHTARVDVDHMWSYHDRVCGGGLWWSAAKKYKNAITNELFIKAAAELHTRIHDDRRYLRESLTTWRWFNHSGMINAHHLVNDGLDTRSCRNNHHTAWSYNQGVILGGLVDLARATHDHGYLRQARVLADASTDASALHVDGILTEPCEAGDCGADGPSFKGVYVRNLGELAHATSSASYRAYLQRDADAAHGLDRTPYDQYGVHWSGPNGPITSATQQSAVDLMVAALH